MRCVCVWCGVCVWGCVCVGGCVGGKVLCGSVNRGVGGWGGVWVGRREKVGGWSEVRKERWLTRGVEIGVCVCR